MSLKISLFVLILILLILPNCFAHSGEGFEFWKGPNGYNYSKKTLKVHLESATSRVNSEFNPEICSETKYSELLGKLSSYQATVDKIKESVISGSYNKRTYNDLVDFLDTYGPRLTGSDALEKSINHLKEQFENVLGQEAVWTQPVNVPKWKRLVIGCLLEFV